MKYQLFTVPNQDPSLLVLKGTRATFDDIVNQYKQVLSARAIVAALSKELSGKGEGVVVVCLDKKVGHELLKLAGLSY